MFSPRLLLSLILLGFVSVASAAPTVSQLSPTSGSTVSSLTSISVTFSEAVTGVNADDLLINNDSAVNVSGSGAGPYVFTFTQPSPGALNISWDFDHGIAGIGTGAFVQNTWSYTLTDTQVPTVAKVKTSVAGQDQDAIAPLPSSTVGALTQVELSFSEAVTGVDAADLLINGTPATGLSGSGAGPYVFTFDQPSAGPVTFQWAASHGITDLASPANAFGGGSWSVTLAASGLGTVVINEFLAANATSITDEDTDGSGWIELYNPGTSAVNLAGWALTNDTDQPAMWVFPNRTIAANGYLVVFASGKDRKPAAGNLHTNFKLNPNGGYLALMTPNAPRTAASVVAAYPAQRFDYSYGTATGGVLRYFARPGTTTDTRPGTANGNSALTSFLPKPSFSVTRGFFKDPFTTVISSSDPTATIRYTLDGSDVTATSTAYTAPLNVTGTTIVRAAAFSTTAVPSATVTHSYIFLDGVLSQPSPPYDNPAVTGDEANPKPPTIGGVAFPVAWGSQSNVGFPGLVTNLSANQIPADYGMDPEIINDPNKYDDTGAVNAATGKTNLERVKAGLRELPILSVVLKNDDMFGPAGLYPNSTQKGTGFEKQCSVEMLLPDGSTAFATTCGIRMHGNSSRNAANNPKHSFKLNFKGDFGASSLNYKMFADSPVNQFDDIILRGDYNSSWTHWDGTGTGVAGGQRARGTRLRDAWAKATFRAMGRPAGHHRYVNLFINGIYWGTYDPTEQENNGFAAAYFGGDKNDYDVMEQGALKSGTQTAYSAMISIASPIDNTKYEQMKGYLDVPEFIDYMLFHFYIGHEDWGDDVNKNWYAVRNKNGGTFKYLPWDMENILWSPTVDRTNVGSPASGLHPKLVSNPQYLLDFADRVHKHMVAPDGALQPAASIARWNQWKSILTDAIAGESARWGDYRRDVHQYNGGAYPLYTWNNQWIAESTRLTGTYFPNRITSLTSPNTGVLPQLRTRGLYPMQDAPQYLTTDGSNTILASRSVTAGFQVKLQLPTTQSRNSSGTLTTNTGTIYYTTDGSDPRVYYAGTVATGAQIYSTPLTINSTTTVRARSLTGSTWSALNEITFTVGFAPQPIRITEIMYNPPAGGSAAEFIELQNISNAPVDMSGWYFDGIDFVFPNGFTLGAGSRLVLASNNAPATFASTYPGVSVAGYFGGSLDNSGERIALYDAAGRVETVVEYNDKNGWPVAADGSGYSLEIVDPAGDPNAASNWVASGQLKGTPGLANSTSGTPSIEISEVLAENSSINVGGAVSDYIELRNTGTSTVDVSAWRLTSTLAPTFFFPSGTQLAPGAYLTVLCDAGTGGSLLHTGWPLNGGSTGQELILSNAAGTRVDGIRWGNQVANLSIGKVNGTWMLTNPTPGAANTAASTAPATGNLVLNEWLANSSPQASDWLELYNKHITLPVALKGLSIQTSTQLYVIPTLSFVGPGGWLQLFADEGAGANHLEFALPAAGTTLSIRDAGGATVDTATFGTQVEGISQGRQTDGAATIVAFGSNPTPGRANALIANYTGPTFNEVLAINTSSALTAPWGSPAPWVEFFNSGASAVDLSGMGFGPVQDPNTTAIFRFPAGTSISAGGFLTVWLGVPPPNTVVPAGTLYVNQWVTAPDGATFYLFDKPANGSNVLDSIVFGTQIADRSIGRTGAGWKLLSSPTLNAVNGVAATVGSVSNVRINEWAAGGGLPTPYVELFNTDTLPVDISGCFLTDDPSEVNLTKSPLRPLSFIAPGGWQRYEAFSSTLPGYVNFQLDAGGESLRLSKPDTTLIDSVSFGLQIPGQSEGRYADGLTINRHLLPTPGFANTLLPVPVITQQPLGRGVPVGGSATFTVSASSSTAVSYQWKFNNADIGGATASTLTVSNVTSGQEGIYTCVVTNPAGSVTSAGARLALQISFANWAAGYGLTGANAAFNADPDRDGLTNLQEYFHNLNPNTPSSVAESLGLPIVGFEPGSPAYLTLTYRQNLRAAPSLVELQASGTLGAGSWSTVTPSVTQTLSSDSQSGDPLVRVKVIVQPSETKKFLRLQLTP